ncbi:peptidase, M50 family [Ostertagia ostertagi]
MLFTAALSYFLISWSSIFLLDYVLRIRNFTPYVNFANKYGLEVAPFQLRIYTTRYNEGAYLPASKDVPVSRKLKSLWFSFGAVAALVCLVGITIYLSHIVYRDTSYLLSLRPKVAPYRSIPHTVLEQTSPEAKMLDDLPMSPTEEYDVLDASGGSETGLVPIIPGVNLPWSHIPIFVVVLAVAAIIHEIGHSAAATTYNVRVNGFGVFLLGLYPGAFTDIDTESLKRSHPRHRLEVFGGGIWHNIVLAGIAYVMFLWTPYFLSPFFGQGQGVTVTGVDSRSGLYGAGGLAIGNVVDSIDDCAIRKHEDWRECVRHLEKNRHGQCVPRTAVEASLATKTSMSLDEMHCCDDFTNITHAHMCFESMLDITTKHLVTKAQSLNRVLRVGIIEPAQEIVRKKRKRSRQFSCLSAQYVTSQPTCSNTSSCAVGEDGEERVCVFAALFNGTQLARISVRNHVRPVLYVGNLDELITYVRIDGLVARFSWVPHHWAESVELVPKYLFTLSLALGLLNSVPCYALDGQYIVVTCVNWSCKMFSRRRRQQLITIILSLGTLLLAANVVIGFVKMVV